MWKKSTNKTQHSLNPEGTWSLIISKPAFIGMARDEQQKKQFIFNGNKWTMSNINFDGEYNNIIGSKVIQTYNENDTQLLAFGGFSGDNIRKHYRRICGHDINVNVWKKLGAVIPKQLQNFGMVSIINQYVVIFGGYSNHKKSVWSK